MVKGYSEVRVSDSGDKGRVFGRGWEKVEVVAVDWDINGQDRGNFYCR